MKSHLNDDDDTCPLCARRRGSDDSLSIRDQLREADQLLLEAGERALAADERALAAEDRAVRAEAQLVGMSTSVGSTEHLFLLANATCYSARMQTDTPSGGIPPAAPPATPTFSPGAHALASLGSKTEAVVKKHLSAPTEAPNLFEKQSEDTLKKLAGAMSGTWTDERAAEVVDRYFEITKQRHIEPSSLIRWVTAHPNEPGSVIDCLNIEPPADLSINRVLSRKGSQKLVFLATWRLHQRQVVAKTIAGPPEFVKKLIDRETQSHPFSMDHPNIIKTHLMRNSAAVPFLVEDYVDPLSDKTYFELEEASNLFFDIGNALHELHSREMVHGDVKPDNIGRQAGRYLLLDFGIARATKDFSLEVTATGSLRTRAPELLDQDTYKDDPRKADVWALAATVFNSLVRRFPLLDMEEPVPRITDRDARKDFEKKLRDRVEKEWAERTNLTGLPERIKESLRRGLDPNPTKRPSVDELLQRLKEDLGLYLRHASDDIASFSPAEELKQLKQFLTPEAIALAPQSFRHSLRERLSKLKGYDGIDEDAIKSLLSSLK